MEMGKTTEEKRLQAQSKSLDKNAEMKKFDSWDAGGTEVYLYTEEWSAARELKSDFPHPTVYFRGTQPFAWQFVVPKRILPLLKKKYLLRKVIIDRDEEEQPENSSIEIQEVTAV